MGDTVMSATIYVPSITVGLMLVNLWAISTTVLYL